MILGTCALALAGCDPTIWDALRDEAPVHLVSPPNDGIVGRFGSVLVGYEATVGGNPVSRFAVSGGVNGGEGSTFSVFYGFDGSGESAFPRFTEAASFVGCDMGECGTGHGASIAAFPEWRGPGGATFHSCVAVPASGTGQIQVRCEDQLPNYQTVMGTSDEAFGTSGAGIELAQHRAGVALFGAPRAAGGNGALYRLPNGGAAPILVNLSSASAPPGGAIGTAVAVTAVSMRALRFATRLAYAGDVQRVIVGTLDVDDADVTTVEIHACLEGARGWGGALAWGDLDGDDVADLAVGTTEEAVAQEIDVFDGNDFVSTLACGDAGQPTPATEIACADVVNDEQVSCDTPIEFGSALAIGDVDADGVNDLIAGAPAASPRGHGGGGAVVVVAGDAGALASLGARSAVLYHSSVRDDDRLGAAVTTLRGRASGGRNRREILAGAPGRQRVVVFACSGISGDQPDDVGGPNGCLGGM